MNTLRVKKLRMMLKVSEICIDINFRLVQNVTLDETFKNKLLASYRLAI